MEEGERNRASAEEYPVSCSRPIRLISLGLSRSLRSPVTVLPEPLSIVKQVVRWAGRRYTDRYGTGRRIDRNTNGCLVVEGESRPCGERRGGEAGRYILSTFSELGSNTFRRLSATPHERPIKYRTSTQ